MIEGVKESVLFILFFYLFFCNEKKHLWKKGMVSLLFECRRGTLYKIRFWLVPHLYIIRSRDWNSLLQTRNESDMRDPCTYNDLFEGGRKECMYNPSVSEMVKEFGVGDVREEETGCELARICNFHWVMGGQRGWTQLGVKISVLHIWVEGIIQAYEQYEQGSGRK